jgi:hypothetical protein
MAQTISRRTFEKLMVSAGASLLMPALARADTASGFVHPGILHNSADLARMRDGVRNRSQPILSGFEAMSANAGSQVGYKRKGAVAEISRNPTVHAGDFDQDANAAYQCSLMWAITGNQAYAQIAIAILNNWAATLKRITGADAVLCAALGGFKIVNAAEVIRYTAAQWPGEDVRRFEDLLRSTFLPVIDNFAPYANGNWDTAAIKLMMAIGIYCDDRVLFDRAVNYYMHGCGDGRLAHYIYDNGQCQESGRDQQHTQLGLAHMGDACEMAWHQGLDLYSELDNRLLLGFEYTAKYELGEEVPFLPDVDQTGNYRHTVISPRSRLRNNFEQIYNHYVNRMGLPAPWVTKAAQQVRPEGAPFGADATGFGTLLYSRPLGKDQPSTAGARTVLYADGSRGQLALEFVPLVDVERYDLWRADKEQGPFRIVGHNLNHGGLRDTSAVLSKLAFYRVSASGSSNMSAAVGQMLGVPHGWMAKAAGMDASEGTDVACGGTSFLMHSGASSMANAHIPYRILERELPKDGVVVARLLPLIASQFLEVGLIVRGEKTDVRLLISRPLGQADHGVWSATLAEHHGDADPRIAAQVALSVPVLVWGRIGNPVWLRLADASGVLRASISPDGVAWQDVGHVDVPSGHLFAGMIVSSGIPGVSTDVVFDHVSVG